MFCRRLLLVSACGLFVLHSACSQAPEKPGARRYDAVRATEAYNDFMERTLRKLNSLPSESERIEFVGDLRPQLEMETSKWRKQFDGEKDAGTLGRTMATPEYQAEFARMQRLAKSFAAQVGRYDRP